MSHFETTLPLPPYWGDDQLSEFFTDAFNNSLATFVQKRPQFEILLKVDKAFHKIAENLANPSDFLAALFLVRAHSAYRASARLACSGQVAETFPVLRSCIEYALYALHINMNADLGEAWMRRHDDDASLRTCRREFKHVNVIKSLESKDSRLHATIVHLYERTIDFGAHPNERGISSGMTLEEGSDKKTFQTRYLHGDELVLDHAMKTTAQIGLGALSILEHVFPQRFRLLNIDSELETLRNRL